ncbi:hypothetical protein lerEdw1_013109 [Lerista edwardsae]|nr:hypothetical protein lerEdw1_013109 [Lerista edwardsae]
MAGSCCVTTCNNRRSRGSNVTFHRFPIMKEDLLKKWLLNIGREDFSPSYNDVVCSEHFRESDFWGGVVSGRKNLKPGVVPTIFRVPGGQKKSARKGRPRKKRPPVRRKSPDPAPVEVSSSDVELSSSKSDMVILDHSYSAPGSPVLPAGEVWESRDDEGEPCEVVLGDSERDEDSGHLDGAALQEGHQVVVEWSQDPEVSAFVVAEATETTETCVEEISATVGQGYADDLGNSSSVEALSPFPVLPPPI